jgi:hypothetical protein
MSTGALRSRRTAHNPANPPPMTTTFFRFSTWAMEQNLAETRTPRRAKMFAAFIPKFS